MKNVLVLLHDDDGQESRLQVALDVARAIDGHLVGLDVVIPPAVAADFTGIAEAMVLEYAYAHESKNRAGIVERLEKEDVPFSMIDATGSAAGALRDAATLADLVVVTARPGEHTPTEAMHTVSEVVVKSHRPVLAVPPGCKGINLSGKAVVAWDGSHAAGEALRGALPLLRLASSVTVLEIDPDGQFEADDAAEYLSRHDIHAKVLQLRGTEASVVEKILAKAKDLEAAYIVMGAYGHSRALQALFGGVTVGMLYTSEIPLLLAH